MHRRQYLASVATAATATIAGCGVLSDEGNSNGLVDEAKDKVDPDGVYSDNGHIVVAHTENRTYEQGRFLGVRGTVENISEQDYAYVELTFSYYSNESKVNEDYASTMDLAAGATWEFETSGGYGYTISDWRITEITVEKA